MKDDSEAAFLHDLVKRDMIAPLPPQPSSVPSDDDVARAAVERGYMTSQQMEECIREHSSAPATPLWQTLVRKRLLTTEQLIEILGPGPPMPAAPAEKKDRTQRFGHYELLTRIGQGASGRVYRAHDPRLKRVVAVKTLERTPTAITVERFVREAQLMARLRHENVVPVFELLEDGGRHAIAMELVEGGSLQDELDRRARPVRELVRIVQKAAEGLDFVHRHGIVHRDVKPANILLDPAGRPRVTDFGLARIASDDSKLTLPGTTLGTPAYMSPEQASGGSEQTDARTDVYSLGVILYEILTGCLPFTAASATEILRRIIDEEPVAPRRLNRNIPRDLEAICLKAMEKEPERRFATAGELAADLERFLNGEPVSARPPSLPRRLRRFARRHPRGTLAACASVLIVAAAAAIWLNHLATRRQQHEAERRHEEAQVRLVRVETLGREITEWDVDLYKRPKDVHFPTLIDGMSRLAAELERLRAEDPDCPNVYYHLARARQRLGRIGEAQHDLEEALRRSPGNPAYLLARGMLTLQLTCEDYLWTLLSARALGLPGPEEDTSWHQATLAQAVADLEACQQGGLTPLYADYVRSIIVCIGGSNEAAHQAIREFGARWSRDVGLTPLKAEAYYFLASRAFRKPGGADQALTLVTEALDIRRCFPEAFMLRAFCLIALMHAGFSSPDKGLESLDTLGKLAAAAEHDAQRAIEMRPNHFGGYLAKGTAQFDFAYQQFVKQAGRDAHAAGDAVPRMLEAIACLGQAIALDPTSGVALTTRASACVRLSQILARLPKDLRMATDPKDLAEKALRDADAAASRLAQPGWVVDFVRSLAWEAMGDIAAAMRALESASAAAGQDRRALERLANRRSTLERKLSGKR